MSQKKKYFILVLFGIVLGIFLKIFIVDISKVSGTSMEPSIKNNSTVIINKLAYGLCVPLGNSLFFSWTEPKKNDIVLYIYNGKPVIKRVLATENDSLEFSIANGYSLIVGENTIPLTEGQYQRLKYSSQVPLGSVLCIGDNYEESVDSRDYGFVLVNSILGKVLCK